MNIQSNDSLSRPIIIVDDLEIAADLLERFLMKSGFQNVKKFYTPHSVIGIFNQVLPYPAFIITDYKMPGINGMEMLCELKVRNPLINGIIITGAPEMIKENPHHFKILQKGSKDFFQIIKQEILSYLLLEFEPDTTEEHERSKVCVQ